MREGTRRYLKWGLRLVGPVILVVVVLRLPKPVEVLSMAASADVRLLLLGLVLNVLVIHIKVVRWQTLLRVRGIFYDTKNAWLAFASSLYLAMFTPGRVGDVLRIQYLRHDRDVPYAEGLASVVMDRLCDLYVLAAFVAVAIAHYSGVVVGRLAVASWCVVALTVIGPLVLLVPGIAEKTGGVLYRRVSKEPEGKGLQLFLVALRAQVGKALIRTLPLTVIAFLAGFAQAWLIAQAMGLDISFFDVVCLTAVASLLGLLPISISGVGVREATFAVIFPSLGCTVEQGVGYGIMVFVMIYLASAAVGFVSWQIRPPPLAKPSLAK